MILWVLQTQQINTSIKLQHGNFFLYLRHRKIGKNGFYQGSAKTRRRGWRFQLNASKEKRCPNKKQKHGPSK